MLRWYLSPSPNFFSDWLWPYCDRGAIIFINSNQTIPYLLHYKPLLTINLEFKSQIFSFFRIKILTLNIEEVGTTTTSITPFLLLKPFLSVGLLLSMSLDLSQLHKNGGKIFKLAVRLNRDLCFQGSIW